MNGVIAVGLLGFVVMFVGLVVCGVSAPESRRLSDEVSGRRVGLGLVLIGGMLVLLSLFPVFLESSGFGSGLSVGVVQSVGLGGAA